MDRGEVDRLLRWYETGRITRRELVAVLAALVASEPTTRAQTVPAPIPVRTLNHVTLFVSDVARSVDFYRTLFGLRVQSRQAAGTNLAVGDGPAFLGVFSAGAGTPAIHHVCLGVERFDADAVLQTLERRGVNARIRPRGETRELYLTDPDGITVQLQDATYCGGGGALGNRCD